MESVASEMAVDPPSTVTSDLALEEYQPPTLSSTEEQASPVTLKQDLGPSMNGYAPDGLKTNGSSRAIMKNGKPRPSAVRDYPEEIGLRRPKTEGANGAPEDVSGKEKKTSDQEKLDEVSPEKAEKVSKKETPDEVSPAKTDKASNLLKKKPAVDSSTTPSGVSQGENETPKAEKPLKAMRAKAGNLEQTENDVTKKVAKTQSSPGKKAAVRDYPEGATPNVDQEEDSQKPDASKSADASSAKRRGDKRSRSRETVQEEESSPGSKATNRSSAKKLKGSEQETPVADKGSKVTKPSSTEKPSQTSKTPGSGKTKSKAQTSEVLESSKRDTTPKTTRRKSNPTTPSETNKKPRRSGGKGLQSSKSIVDGRDPRQALLETLRMYDALRRKILLDEEVHGKQGKGSRADLQSGSLMKEKGLSLNRGGKVKGAFPGVEVGDQFYFRMELCCIGMHGPLQGGIDYLTVKESEWDTPVAINIISIVGQDGNDNGDQLIYAGQGGRSADNKQTDDQKLERGNLAMDGCKRHDLPVRVVRGIKDASSPAGKIYVYDGLYKVEDSYTVKGSEGFDEYRFKLQRMPGQPQLGSEVIKQASEMKSQSPSSRKDVVVKDISKGKENQPICVENKIDEEKGVTDFDYSVKLKYPNDIDDLESSVGCDCKGVCAPSNKCACFSRNGDMFPYLSNGVLVKEKAVVFECGSNCKCSSNCRNRSTQKGLKFRLEVFRTDNRGWGVRSLESIAAGSFVCEYTGKLTTDLESVGELSDREHVLDLRRLPDNMPYWGDVSSIFADSSSSLDTTPEVAKSEFVIDASQSGNVARFINHSCSPNLFVQRVLIDHNDTRFPQIKLFAMDNIPPLREVTFCYGCPLSEEVDSDINSKECLCGSSVCKGKLFC